MSRPAHGVVVPADAALGPVVDRLWTVLDVAAYLGIPVATLYQWRYLGTGPSAYRVGRHLRYERAQVRAWLLDRVS